MYERFSPYLVSLFIKMGEMMRAYVMGLIAALGVYSATPALAASFDCARASSKLEKMICANAALGAADETMAVVYKKALSVGGDAVKAEQKGWLKSRNACRDEACVLGSYRDRLLLLAVTSEFVAPPKGQPLMVLPPQKDQGGVRVRNTAGAVIGMIAFGHDAAGGKYDIETPDGIMTLSYVWDLSDAEQNVLNDLEEKRVSVYVSGTVQIYEDGTGSFSRNSALSLYPVPVVKK